MSILYYSVYTTNTNNISVVNNDRSSDQIALYKQNIYIQYKNIQKKKERKKKK